MAALTLPVDTYLIDPDLYTWLTNAKANYDNSIGKKTQSNLTDTATVTAAQLLSGVIRGVPTAAANYTTPTAALLVAAMTNPAVGDSFEVVINNKSAGANTITVVAGSGCTAEGTLTVAQNVARKFIVYLTNVTASSEAYTIVGC